MVNTTLVLATIGGALIVAVVSQLTLWLIEVRRDRGERRGQASDVLRAVRLIDEELGWNMRVLRRSMQTRTWWRPGHGPSLDAWSEHASALAGEVHPGTWAALARATMAVRVLLRIGAELEAQPDAALIWERVDGEADAADELIRDARILIRPVALGGSTFPKTGPAPGGTWFPAVPELGPWDLWPKRRWRRFLRRKRRRPNVLLEDTGESLEIIP